MGRHLLSNLSLLDRDPVSGVSEYFRATDDAGGFEIITTQDCKPRMEANKALQNESFDKRSEMWHAASIPNVIIMKWQSEHGVNLFDPNHKEAVRRLLNSNEYRYLRTSEFIL